MAETMLHYRTITYNELMAAAEKDDVRGTDLNTLCCYAAEDTRASTWQLYQKLLPNLNERICQPTQLIEIPLMPILAQMEDSVRLKHIKLLQGLASNLLSV